MTTAYFRLPSYAVLVLGICAKPCWSIKQINGDVLTSSSSLNLLICYYAMPTITLPGGWTQPIDTFRISASFLILSVVYYIVSSIYDVYFGPLSRYPGPKLWAFSLIPRIMTMVNGDDAEVLAKLHQQYGGVVRTGPRELSYASGATAWKDVYGFKKHGAAHPYKDPMFYGKPLNGVDSLITAEDFNHGRQRKILSHAFSDKTLKEQEPLLKRWATLMRKKLSERANGEDHVDMLKYYNCTTFDVMGKNKAQLLCKISLTLHRRLNLQRRVCIILLKHY